MTIGRGNKVARLGRAAERPDSVPPKMPKGGNREKFATVSAARQPSAERQVLRTAFLFCRAEDYPTDEGLSVGPKSGASTRLALQRYQTGDLPVSRN